MGADARAQPRPCAPRPLPPAAAVVENANRITRGVMRRYTRTKAATQPDDDDLPAIAGAGWIERYARCAAPLATAWCTALVSYTQRVVTVSPGLIT